MAIRCISKAVILLNDAVLLNKCKRADGRIYYSLPGGGQNIYETLEQAVVREVKEETGYDVCVNRFIALLEEIYTNNDMRANFQAYTHRISHIFQASLISDKKEMPIEKDFEMEDSVWMPLSNAEQLIEGCSPWLINLLRNLKNGNMPIYLGTEYID